MALDGSKISKLGFGCMRFEGREDDSIDIEQVSGMIDAYMEADGNYFDTAWAYPNSEAALGKALVVRHPRDSFFIASKCLTWNHCESTDDLEKQLQETLANLGVEYVDVYLMHNLGGKRTTSFEKYGAWEFMKSVKERGLAKQSDSRPIAPLRSLRGSANSIPKRRSCSCRSTTSTGRVLHFAGVSAWRLRTGTACLSSRWSR